MERDRFIAEYTTWRCKQGLPRVPEVPFVRGIEINLADLWTAVKEEQGSQCVSKRRLWAVVGRKLNPPVTESRLSVYVRSIFAEHLLEYERSIDPGRAMPRLRKVKKKRSAKVYSSSTTLSEDTYSSEASSERTKRHRSPSSSPDQLFPTLNSAKLGRHPPIDMHEESLDDLTRAYVLCESLLNLLHAAIESAKIKERKQQRANKRVSEDNEIAANDASGYGP